MIGYECMTGMYFKQDEDVIMDYFKTLNDGDKIPLCDVLDNLGIKQRPQIANKFDIIIRKPLYRKVFNNKHEYEIMICFEECKPIYHV
jgi:hypothetical protein